jgi:hypothetical protein
VGDLESVETVALSVRWRNIDELPVLPANQFAVQLGGIPSTLSSDQKPDGVYLIIGHAAPPLLVASSAEEQKMQLEALSEGIEVRPHGRFLLSRGRLQELSELLQQAIKAYDGAGEDS